MRTLMCDGCHVDLTNKPAFIVSMVGPGDDGLTHQLLLDLCRDCHKKFNATVEPLLIEKLDA